MRELQNCIERAVILAEGETIQPRHLNLSFAAPEPADDAGAIPWAHDRPVGHAGRRDAARVVEVERRKIARLETAASSEADSNKGRAPPSSLQISYKTLLAKLQEHRASSRRLRRSQPDRRRRALGAARSSVTSVTIVVRADRRSAARSAACRRRPSCRAPIASSTCRGGEIGDRRAAAPSATISARERVAIRPRTARRARRPSAAAASMPVGDRLAVAEAPVLRDRLERVADRVAEIERRRRPGLALVRRDDRRLDPAATRAMTGTQHVGIAREQRRQVALRAASNSGAARR